MRYFIEVVEQDASVFVQGGTCLGFIKESCKLPGWPLVKRELSTSQSLASASTHVLYVTEAAGETGRQRQMAKSPEGISTGFSLPY